MSKKFEKLLSQVSNLDNRVTGAERYGFINGHHQESKGSKIDHWSNAFSSMIKENMVLNYKMQGQKSKRTKRIKCIHLPYGDEVDDLVVY